MITCTISSDRKITLRKTSSPVGGEHNANIVAISMPNRIGDADLDGCTMYACAYKNNGNVEKVPLEMSPDDDGYTATWIITRNTTSLQGRVWLYYEWTRGTELVVKTCPANMDIIEVPDVDGEIAQQYPTILQDHEARIEYLEDHGGVGGVASPDIDTIRVMDQAEFEKLPVKNSDTLYFIRG